MTIALTRTQEQLIERLVNAGRYGNASEALDTALQLLEERERHYEQWREETRQKVPAPTQGTVRVLITFLEERAETPRKSKLPLLSVGRCPENFSLHREDMYGDDDR